MLIPLILCWSQSVSWIIKVRLSIIIKNCLHVLQSPSVWVLLLTEQSCQCLPVSSWSQTSVLWCGQGRQGRALQIRDEKMGTSLGSRVGSLWSGRYWVTWHHFSEEIERIDWEMESNICHISMNLNCLLKAFTSFDTFKYSFYKLWDLLLNVSSLDKIGRRNVTHQPRYLNNFENINMTTFISTIIWYILKN